MLRLVIGDSDSRSRKRLREIVMKQGHLVVGEARDGLAALTQIRSTQPDIIILEAQLPVMEGLEVANIAAESNLAPVILIYNLGQQDSLRRLQKPGVFAYVYKPFTESSIMAALESAQENYQRVMALEQEIDQLKESLEVRKLVDKAKGLLMKQHGLDENEAFHRIQQMAMKRRVPKKAIAEAIILSLEVQ